MKLKVTVFGLLLLAASGFVIAQTDAPILTIDSENVTRSEFEKVFRKNNSKETTFSKKDVSDYLELFINYKLKVREALELKMDTVQAFQNELAGYRKQLAQPYLVDKAVTDSLLHEAYNRMKKEIRASHILVRVTPEALPKDTLEAYNKILRMRNEISKGGSFAEIAKQESEDQSARETGGDLGYFTSLQMVYPFENAAFNTGVGQVSQPVRTRFGYHLIKVTDVRPAQGEIKVAHIMVKSPAGASPEDSLKAVAKANEIYGKLKTGENFESLARQYSDDHTSAKAGGALPMFGTGRMVPEFERASFALKNIGDFSEPVKTAYGWHIIKLLERKPLGSFEDLQAEIKAKVTKDSRSELSKASMVNRIKQKYGFRETPKAKDEFLATVDTSILSGQWTAERAMKLTGPMFTLGNQPFMKTDFATYVVDHQTRRTSGSPKQFTLDLYQEWVNESVIEFEESRLDANYPEFKALMQEYRDGILLFELTDQKVWSRAVKDSAGLKQFYDRNENNYMWPKRVFANVYTCSTPEVARQLRKLLKKDLLPDSILKIVNKDSQLSLQLKQGKYARGDHEIVDSVAWVVGVSPDIKHNGQIVVVDIRQVLEAQPKTLDEARGLITSEYQNYLEKEWIATLRKKYPVVVHQEVVDSVVN